MSKMQGSDLMVFAGGKSIALAKNHTLEITMNTVDTSTKDNGNGRWQDNEAGLRSWSMSTENLVTDGADPGATPDEIVAALISGEKVEVIFGLQGDITDYTSKEDEKFVVPEGGWKPSTNHYKGSALVTSCSFAGNNGDRATFNATFTGCGALMPVGKGISSKAAAAALSAAPGTPVAVAAAETASASKAK